MNLVNITYHPHATNIERSSEFYQKIYQATIDSLTDINEIWCGDIEILGKNYLIDIYHDSDRENNPIIGYTYVYLENYSSNKCSTVSLYVFKR
jgi:hypothetical protein